MNKSDFSYNLKRKGLKSTNHRLAVLDILEKSSKPISAEEIFNTMTGKDSMVNLSTVYRILEVLFKNDLITKLSIDGNIRVLFEFNRMLHTHHLVCLGCKEILPIDNCPLEGYEKALSKETNYTITGHKLGIYGYCPKCQGRNSINNEKPNR